MICKGCDGPIRRHNRYGLCQRNPDCKRENKRLEKLAHQDAYRRYHQSYRESHRELLRQRYRKYYYSNLKVQIASKDCAGLTYLFYSARSNQHKIGYSANPSKRLCELRTGCPDVEMLAIFPYGRRLEKWLHGYYANDRIDKTEWFTGLNETMVRAAVAIYEREVAA